eukprot:6174376-Pleurochrysis_carterae.AAC.2
MERMAWPRDDRAFIFIAATTRCVEPKLTKSSSSSAVLTCSIDGIEVIAYRSRGTEGAFSRMRWDASMLFNERARARARVRTHCVRACIHQCMCICQCMCMRARAPH